MTDPLRVLKPTLAIAFSLLLTSSVLSDVGPSKRPSKPLELKDKSETLSIREGDSIQSLLIKNSFSEDQAYQSLVQNVLPKSFIMIPGEKYRVSYVRSQDKTTVEFYHPLFAESYSFWKSGKNIGFQKRVPKITIKKVNVSGQVHGSLIESIRSKVDSMWIAFRVMDAFTLDFNLKKHIKRGAQFEITFEERYEGKTLIGRGQVLRAALEIDGRMHERQFYSFSNQAGIFVNPLDAENDKPLFAPVDYLRVSSLFQPRRFHPIRKRYQAHLGVDFALPEGSRIYAAFSGRVIKRGYNRAAGNFVAISHPNGLTSYYDHLKSHVEGLEIGQYVTSGEVIGYMGCTGYCTSPHLHFAIKKRGVYVDPVPFMKPYTYRKKEFVEEIVAKAKARRRSVADAD